MMKVIVTNQYSYIGYQTKSETDPIKRLKSKGIHINEVITKSFFVRLITTKLGLRYKDQ